MTPQQRWIMHWCHSRNLCRGRPFVPMPGWVNEIRDRCKRLIAPTGPEYGRCLAFVRSIRPDAPEALRYDGHMADFHMTADGKRLIDLDRVTDGIRVTPGDVTLYLEGGMPVRLTGDDAAEADRIRSEGRA